MTDSRMKLAKLSAGIREVLSSEASSDLAWTMLRCFLGKEGLGLSGIADAIDEVLAEPRFIQQGSNNTQIGSVDTLYL